MKNCGNGRFHHGKKGTLLKVMLFPATKEVGTNQIWDGTIINSRGKTVRLEKW
jgi:hypothetical protein